VIFILEVGTGVSTIRAANRRNAGYGPRSVGSGGPSQALAHADARASRSLHGAVAWCIGGRGDDCWSPGPFGRKERWLRTISSRERETSNCLGSRRVVTLALSSCEIVGEENLLHSKHPPVTSKGRRNFRARAFSGPDLVANDCSVCAFRRERCKVSSEPPLG
jgi:hypothetical protein